MKLPVAIYVEWVDSEGHAGWCEKHDIDEMGLDEPVRTIGWLVREGADYLIVASHWASDERAAPYHSPLVIPKVAIIKRKVIKL